MDFGSVCLRCDEGRKFLTTESDSSYLALPSGGFVVGVHRDCTIAKTALGFNRTIGQSHQTVHPRRTYP